MYILSKNLLSKTLKSFSVLTLFGVLLGHTFTSPSLAMDHPDEIIAKFLSHLPRENELCLLSSASTLRKPETLKQKEVGLYHENEKLYCETRKGIIEIVQSDGGIVGYPSESFDRILNGIKWTTDLTKVGEEDQKSLLAYISFHDYTLPDQELAITAQVSKQWQRVSYRKIYSRIYSDINTALKEKNHYIHQQKVATIIKNFSLDNEQKEVLNLLVVSCLYKIKSTPGSQFHPNPKRIKMIVDLIGEYAWKTNKKYEDGNSWKMGDIAPEPLSLNTSRYGDLSPAVRIQKTIDCVYDNKHVQEIIRTGKSSAEQIQESRHYIYVNHQGPSNAGKAYFR